MKLFIILNIFIISCWSLPTSEIFDENWAEFKYTHNKTYNSLDEELERFSVFQSNLKIIEEHNKLYNDGLVTFEMGLNQFTDLTADEFLYYAVGLLNTTNNRSSKYRNIFKSTSEKTPLRKFVDWRSHGLVTKVKNQKNCGSCWSFSATGSIEGQYAKKMGKLLSLSEQNLIDCSSKYGNHGCKGGLMDFAFNYVKDNGIEAESDYHYEATDYKNSCRFNRFLSKTSISNYVDIENNENDLQQAIDKIGPISVAIHVRRSMQFYMRGVYYDSFCSSTALNHGVLAVGYGTDNKGAEYYIVKNSWGTTWGENGYIKMARNKHNNCGIATMASYPVL